VLTGKMPLDMCLSKDPRSPLVVLPCLQTPANPADMLASQAMQKLMENLERVFDLVIIDSAPVLLVNDTKILSHLADAVMFVVRWEKDPARRRRQRAAFSGRRPCLSGRRCADAHR